MLDVTGLNTITDEGLASLVIEEKGVEGIRELRHLRLSGLNKITDEPTIKFCTRNRCLTILELCRCRALTIAGIESMIKALPCLKKININMIPKIKVAKMKDTLESKPGLEVIQFAMRNVDLKDNGLRVPLPRKSKKKKKKKKKGKKK